MIWFVHIPIRIEQALAWYLRKRGWVVFSLDEEARHCGYKNQGCWLQLYNATVPRKKSVLV